MTGHVCAICTAPGIYPARTRIEALKSTRTLWYCLSHWRQRMAPESPNPGGEDCGVCKRLGQLCFDHRRRE